MVDPREQEVFWQGCFGDEYTLRNTGDWDEMYLKEWGVTRTDLNREFLSELPRDAKILEIGCNRGHQLELLRNLGFSDLSGVDINERALNVVKEVNPDFKVSLARAQQLPFASETFDMVFTSLVLIHIAPQSLSKVMDEIFRVSKRYIWGFEYFSPECQEIPYRGFSNKLWKNDFPKLFMDRHPSLKVVKRQFVPYVHEDLKDIMYLLEKRLRE